MTRTDIHAPASPDFDPEAYDCWGVFDTAPEWGDSKGRIQTMQALTAQGFKIGHGNSNKCGHCGTHIRYAALMVHTSAKEFIFVGEDCLSNRFEEMTKAEFQMLRKAAKLNREREVKAHTVQATFDANPWLNDCPTYGGEFLDSLYAQAKRGKVLSERQIEAGQKALAKAKEREAQFQARKAGEATLIDAGVQAPEGKVTVTGKVVKVKWQDSPYGGALKMIVETAEGWKVWSTVPKSLQGITALVAGEGWKFTPDVQEGQMVEFTATLTQSDRDPLFAFAKRPTNAKILESA
jgi:hypothetical protein